MLFPDSKSTAWEFFTDDQLRALDIWTAAERALTTYKPTSAAEAVELLTLAGKPQERGTLYLDIDEGRFIASLPTAPPPCVKHSQPDFECETAPATGREAGAVCFRSGLGAGTGSAYPTLRGGIGSNCGGHCSLTRRVLGSELIADCPQGPAKVTA